MAEGCHSQDAADQLKQASHFCEELRTQPLPLHLIPGHNRPQVLPGHWINNATWMNQRGATERAPATLRELGNDRCVLV